MRVDNLGLKHRSLLTLDDLTSDQMLALIELAVELKAAKKRGERGRTLEGRHIALVFEKMSTRTRCAAAVAIGDEGGRSEYLQSRDIHLGAKESVADTARVLGRMFDGIFFRGFLQRTVELLAEHSGVPVWNGLTDDAHPTQALADLMTIRESFSRLDGCRVAYVGDGRNNVAKSLMLACVKAGMHFVNCTPPELAPPDALMQRAQALGERHGGSAAVEHDPLRGVQGANVLYSDVWVSMGEESKFEERLAMLRPYQVTMDLVRATGNLEHDRVIFLHCLPAFHNDQTQVTAETGALEVTDEVFEAGFSRVFDLAENRLHTIKALFVATLS